MRHPFCGNGPWTTFCKTDCCGGGPRLGETVPRRVVGMEAERRRVLEGLHDEHAAGHRGVERTYQRAKELYAWRGMWRDAARFVESCEVCQAYSRKRHRDELHPTYPRALLYTWYIDLMVMPRARGYRYLGNRVFRAAGDSSGADHCLQPRGKRENRKRAPAHRRRVG